jgi:signal peptidase II
LAFKQSSNSLLPWLGIALAIILLDQFTKTLILGYFQLGDSRTVTSFFNVVRVHNTGAAFSFLAGASAWARWRRCSSSGCCASTAGSACSAGHWR